MSPVEEYRQKAGNPAQGELPALEAALCSFTGNGVTVSPGGENQTTDSDARERRTREATLFPEQGLLSGLPW